MSETNPTPAGDETQLLHCPFCGDDDFDLIGLQYHLQRGWCEVYGTLQNPNCIVLSPKKSEEADAR